MEENKVFMAVMNNGDKWNIEAKDVIDAATKLGNQVDPKEVFMIIDIPG